MHHKGDFGFPWLMVSVDVSIVQNISKPYVIPVFCSDWLILVDIILVVQPPKATQGFRSLHGHEG
jgi:hypothetical protein